MKFQTDRQITVLNVLRIAALVVTVAGASSSLISTLDAGRHNGSFVLKFLFAVWVLSPFLAMLSLNLLFRRWSALGRATLYILTLVLSVLSMYIYSGHFPAGVRITGVFLMIPLASWVLILILLPLVRLIARKMR